MSTVHGKTHEEVLECFEPSSWQRVVFAEFGASLDSEARPFPCVFGVNGFRSRQLRYLFLDRLDAAAASSALTHFVANARG